jgi:hypothetical protein
LVPVSNLIATLDTIERIAMKPTERCLGCKLRLRGAINDRLGIEADAARSLPDGRTRRNDRPWQLLGTDSELVAANDTFCMSVSYWMESFSGPVRGYQAHCNPMFSAKIGV